MSEELEFNPTPTEEPETAPSAEIFDLSSPLVQEESEVLPVVGRRRALEPSQKKEKKPSPVASLVEFVEVLVSALVAAILVLTLVCRTGVVEGSSMAPTMHSGDRYIISDLFYTPEQGDIVVFRPGIEGREELWIKRVIALEGQEVYIDPDDFKVYVDGEPLDEPYLSEYTGTINKGTENPIVVPKDCVYVLGDNRSVSHDSRYADLGCVEINRLAGRVICRFWPFNSFEFYN
ncbi:MAG: signal peptidase I [Clostridia bacterium]|nr:signal peptidase I [Clostridia bacterium]